MMVIPKPIEFTIVSEVPFESEGALWATRVENMGESAVTANPHINRKIMRLGKDCCMIKNGDSKQQTPEIVKAIVAIVFGAIFCEIKPPRAHDIPPTAMIKKDQSEMLISKPLTV